MNMMVSFGWSSLFQCRPTGVFLRRRTVALCSENRFLTVLLLKPNLALFSERFLSSLKVASAALGTTFFGFLGSEVGFALSAVSEDLFLLGAGPLDLIVEVVEIKETAESLSAMFEVTEVLGGDGRSVPVPGGVHVAPE